MANQNSFFGIGGNSANSIAPDYDMKARKIRKLSEVEEQRLYGFCITKDGQYGRGVLLCGEKDLISLPKRYLETFLAYTDEQKEHIASGRYKICNIQARPTKQGNDTYIFDIADAD